MELINDKADCIKDIENIGTKREVELGNGLQNYINDFLYQESLSLSKSAAFF